MTTTRIYKSSDTSAPVLSGGVSALINVLDKCLVAGYGSKTAAGWTKPYTGTNKAAFRNSVAAGGSGMYVRVEDAGSGTGGARNARARAYATMSGVDTGTIPTPTTGQLANGVIWRKSDTVDSTARAWVLIADERTFYLTVDTGTDANGHGLYGAGDFESFIAGEAYPFFVGGRYTAAADGSNSDGVVDAGMMLCASSTFTADSLVGTWVPRNYSGGGSPVRTNLMCPYSSTIDAGSSSAMPNPSPGSGLLHYIPALMCAEGAIRGALRGVYLPLNSYEDVATGVEVVNPPGLSATLVVVRHFGTNYTDESARDGHLLIDRTSAWA